MFNARFFKSLPDDASPGKQRWLTWRTESPTAPEEDFLPVIARRLYSHAHRCLRQADPNHLIFGDHYHELDMPESVVREALSFVDAIAIQPVSPRFDPAHYTALFRLAGKPIYLADHVTSFRTVAFPRTLGQQSKSTQDYGQDYAVYVQATLGHPAVIGYNKCQYRSRIRTPGYPPLLKQGLLQLDGAPYVEAIRAVTLVNRDALH